MGALTEPDVTNSLFPLASNAISCLQCLELSGSQYLHYGRYSTEISLITIEDAITSHIDQIGKSLGSQMTCH